MINYISLRRIGTPGCRRDSIDDAATGVSARPTDDAQHCIAADSGLTPGRSVPHRAYPPTSARTVVGSRRQTDRLAKMLCEEEHLPMVQ